MDPAGARCLITGIGGFAGPFLARELIRRGHEVVGYGLAAPTWPHAGSEEVRTVEGDVLDREGLAAVLAEQRPTHVYHLAASSHVGRSWSDRRHTLQVNVIGTDTLLECVAAACPSARVLFPSTGQVYAAAAAAGGTPLTEEAPLAPASPYAASKLCAEVLALHWFRARSVDVRVVRPFNFAGPGQAADFVCSDFARQVARIEAGEQPPEIAVGNLDAARDFCDVRDVVRGFVAALERGRAGRTYNLCSGTPVSVRWILERLLAAARTEIDVRVDPDRFRPADVPVFVGDPARAARELHWRTEIPLERTLLDTLEYWRNAVRQTPL